MTNDSLHDLSKRINELLLELLLTYKEEKIAVNIADLAFHIATPLWNEGWRQESAFISE
jgi:hypothetical protein